MDEIELAIETRGEDLPPEWWDGEVEITRGATLTYKHSEIQKAVDLPSVDVFALGFASGVSSSVVGSWLYDKLKGKATSLRIDRIEVNLDEEKSNG